MFLLISVLCVFVKTSVPFYTMYMYTDRVIRIISILSGGNWIKSLNKIIDFFSKTSGQGYFTEQIMQKANGRCRGFFSDHYEKKIMQNSFNVYYILL